MRDHSRLAWIISGKRSLLCKCVHTQYACSHCFIEHLGSISHFKNIGNSTTSVGTEASAMCVCWTRVVPLEGTLNCWCSSASSWNGAAKPRTRADVQIWSHRLGGRWLHIICVCVLCRIMTNYAGTPMRMQGFLPLCKKSSTWNTHLWHRHDWRPTNLRFKQKKAECVLVWGKQTTHLSPDIWV